MADEFTSQLSDLLLTSKPSDATERVAVCGPASRRTVYAFSPRAVDAGFAVYQLSLGASFSPNASVFPLSDVITSVPYIHLSVIRELSAVRHTQA